MDDSLALKANQTDFTTLNNQVNDASTGLATKASKTELTNVMTANTADVKAYTDQKTNAALSDAKGYTDQKAQATLNDAKGYTDQKTASAIQTANHYTDNKIADVQAQVTATHQFIQVNDTDTAQTALATGTGATAIGHGATANGAYNTVIGAGASATGESNTVVGKGNAVQGNRSGAFGDPNTVTAHDSYVIGNDNTVTGDNTFVLGNNVNTKAKNAVVLGNDSSNDRDNTVSVGSKDNLRQITHIAAGTEDTDAVNVAQMKQTNSDTLTSAKSYTDTRINTLESSFQDYSTQVNRRLHEVDKRFDRQGAMSAAMMNMALSTSGLQGRNRIGVGSGFQGDEQAVAVGYQRVVNVNTSLSISGALTDNEKSGGVGLGFSW